MTRVPTYIVLLPCLFFVFASAQSLQPYKLHSVKYEYIGFGQDDALPSIFRESSNEDIGSFRVIYAMEDTMAFKMNISLVKAINHFWPANIDTAIWIPFVRPINKSYSSYRPAKIVDTTSWVVTKSLRTSFKEFKPKLSKRDDNGVHIFVRISDRLSNPAITKYKDFSNVAAILKFECLAFRDDARNPFFERSMDVIIQRQTEPPGSYLLLRIPGLPVSFLQAFDSAARTFFSDSAPPQLLLSVPPVCLFIPDTLQSQIRRLVRFSFDGTTIRVTDGPEMIWYAGDFYKKQSGKKTKEGSGILGAIITSATGLSSNYDKSTIRPFDTQISFKVPDEDSVIIFHLPIKEIETESRENVREGSGANKTLTTTTLASSFERRIDDTCYLSRGVDTIGKFYFSSIPSNVTVTKSTLHCWDGTDTATIMPLPDFWKNDGLFRFLDVRGVIENKPFHITKMNGGNQIDFYYDNQHTATLRVINSLPRDGIIYNADITEKHLRILGMFACLPNAWYGK